MKRNSAVSALVGLALLASCSPDANTQAEGAAAQQAFTDLDFMSVEAGSGKYVANRDGKLTEIMFPIDRTAIDAERRHDSERVHGSSEIVAMLDRYATRANAGQPCATEGTETYLRVFSLTARKQIFEQLVDSCRSAIRGENPPVLWSGDDRFSITGAGGADYVVRENKVVRQP